MSEISDLVAIYGEVDRELAKRPELRPAVAVLIPQYQTDVRWYEDFLEWTDALCEQENAEPFPSLVEALDNLEASSPRRNEQGSRTRRLHAITTLVRAFPEARTDTDGLGRRALTALVAVGAASPIRTNALLEFLGDPDIDDEFRALAPRTPDEHWEALISVGQSRGLAARPAFGRRPCSSDLIEDRGSFIARIDASIPTTLPFASAIAFLDPTTWPTSHPFWCSMVPVGAALPPGKRRFDEVVSVDCGAKHATWTVRATLDFTTEIRAQRAVAQYDLSPGVHNPHVSTDQGFLLVRDRPEGVVVRATKRVRFTRAFSGEALALVICALGYADALEDLVYAAAGEPGPSAARTTTTSGNGSAGGNGGSLVDAVIDRTATWMKASIDECADAAATTADKVAAGDYTTDALVQDAAGAWARMLREGAMGVNAWVDAASAVRAGRR